MTSTLDDFSQLSHAIKSLERTIKQNNLILNGKQPAKRISVDMEGRKATKLKAFPSEDAIQDDEIINRVCSFFFSVFFFSLSFLIFILFLYPTIRNKIAYRTV